MSQFFADRNLETVLLVAAVRIVATQIPVNTGTAQRRTGNAGIDGILGGDHAVADGPLQPDGILGKKPFVGIEVAGEGIDNLLDILFEAGIDIGRKTADTEVVAGHPRAGDLLVQFHDLFALTEGIDEDGHGADIEGVTGNPDQVGLETGQLSQYHPDGLGPLRHLDAKKLFDSQNITEVVAHRGQIVEPVGKRNGLMIGAVLGKLLHTAMQIADMRSNLLDYLAVKFDYKPQNAVS